jgi:hypothetical protein
MIGLKRLKKPGQVVGHGSGYKIRDVIILIQY